LFEVRKKSGLNRVGVAGLIGLVVAVWLLPILPTAAKVKFTTPRSALEQGIAALRTGNLQIAIPALEYAVAHDIFPAQYYLARVYADNNSAITDHPRAFKLLDKFVNRYAGTDPADYRRANTFAKALTRLARYVRDGIPEIGLPANPERAAEYFHHAATFSKYYSDEDAQFELAKMKLTGEGIRKDRNSALHWLSVLSLKGHPGAQAFLADLNWRGKYTKRNPIRALALITIARENAPQEDRVWIEDIHQNIFCGASQGTRRTVSGMVANWRSKFGRPSERDRYDVLLSLDIGPQRTCADGQPVLQLGTQEIAAEKVDGGGASDRATPPQGQPGVNFHYGGTSGGYRETGGEPAPRQ
jgi:hypothetical protein